MSSLTTTEISKYADLQIAAEAFLQGVVDERDYVARLSEGNRHSSRFTPEAAGRFASEWQVLDHAPNTSSGFSGTLFRNVGTREIVMSLRSTEFVDDAVRDNMATNTFEIKNTGFAWGQLADMEKWFGDLKASGKIPAGEKIDVTGYSLGGHLATAFNIMHQADVNKVVTFNGAGIGAAKSGALALTRMLSEFVDFRNSHTFIASALGVKDKVLADIYTELRLKNFTTVAEVNAAKQKLYQVHGGPLTSLATELEKGLDQIAILIGEGERIKPLRPYVGGYMIEPGAGARAAGGLHGLSRTNMHVRASG